MSRGLTRDSVWARARPVLAETAVLPTPHRVPVGLPYRPLFTQAVIAAATLSGHAWAFNAPTCLPQAAPALRAATSAGKTRGTLRAARNTQPLARASAAIRQRSTNDRLSVITQPRS